MIYLVKANGDGVSPCACVATPIAAPAQKDFPWCGCGWTFLCSACRKPFTYARAEEVAHPWERLAHVDLHGRWGRSPSDDEIEGWIEFMKILQKDLKAGATYVYLDGWVFRTDQPDLRFDGWHSKHDFPRAPQLQGPELIERTIGSKVYWDTRRVLTEE